MVMHAGARHNMRPSLPRWRTAYHPLGHRDRGESAPKWEQRGSWPSISLWRCNGERSRWGGCSAGGRRTTTDRSRQAGAKSGRSPVAFSSAVSAGNRNLAVDA